MTGRGDPTRNDPLQPDERALARELERVAPTGGPPPAVDAAILAAAREAAATAARADVPPSPPASAGMGSARARRRPAAWLRGGALAASVIIAVGVSWQLRSRLDPGDSAATATQEAVSVPAAPEEPPVLFDDPTPLAAPAPPAPPAPAEPASVPLPRTAPAPARASPPAPPPPAAAAARASAAMPDPRAQAAAKEARAARERAAAAVGHDHAADEAVETTGMDQPPDDIPPASVDSPAVREAWLARIRELVAAERYDEARESFAEFRRRHPDAPVPDDLQSLLGQ